jgi:hypothetical protein
MPSSTEVWDGMLRIETDGEGNRVRASTSDWQLLLLGLAAVAGCTSPAACVLSEFHPDPRAATASGNLYAVWGGLFAEQPLYAVGESTSTAASGVALARGASRWVPSPLADRGGALFGLWGPPGEKLDSPVTVYAVGRGGRILRFQTNTPDAAWELRATPTTHDLHDVWGTGVETFAVGAGGTIVSSALIPGGPLEPVSLVWRVLNPVPTVDLHGIDGFTSLDRFYRRRAFAVGAGGTILELQEEDTLVVSGRWRRVGSPTQAELNDVATVTNACAANGQCDSPLHEAVAVGAGGVLVVYDGTNWFLRRNPHRNDLHAVWIQNRDRVYAVGANGTILRFSLANRDDPVRIPSGTTATLRGVHGGLTYLVVVGDNSTILVARTE